MRYASGVRDELLSPNLSGQLEMILTTFNPGASSGPDLYAHKGEEGGFVTEGELTLTTLTLRQGDAFQFPSTAPHRYHNSSDARTVILWAVTPPHYYRTHHAKRRTPPNPSDHRYHGRTWRP
ncbi:MAG: cupin domain-containing protein [Amylibacter sp.]